jgi:peptidoglycan/xylan/chitin deacetylase (PgdA/CDA1 family)
MAVSCSNFRAIVRELKSQGFWFLDSNDIIAIKKGEMEQPEKGVFISFDDGYEDNYINAFPIIREEGVKATFFLPSSLIGQPNRMNVEQLKEMAAYGMCFGSHTVNHQVLDKLSDDQIKKEMNDSKYVLQHDYGIKVESLAYPGGVQSELTLQEAAKNYEVAFTASMDVNTPDTIYTIHRYGVFRWNDSLASILKD